jgi:hypothetical protein
MLRDGAVKNDDDDDNEDDDEDDADNSDESEATTAAASLLDVLFTPFDAKRLDVTLCAVLVSSVVNSSSRSM